MGGICPGIFVFRRYVVQHLWYLHSLDSQLCLQCTSWGSVRAICTYNILLFQYNCLFSPYGYLCCLGGLTILGISLWGTTSPWFLFHRYTEVPITLIWRRAWLVLNFRTLFFGLTWLSYKIAQFDSRSINISSVVRDSTLKYGRYPD